MVTPDCVKYISTSTSHSLHGLHMVTCLQSEMEDLCFAVVDPHGYCSLRQQLDSLWSQSRAPTRRSRLRRRAAQQQQQQQRQAEEEKASTSKLPSQQQHHRKQQQQQQQQQVQQQRKLPLSPLLSMQDKAATSAATAHARPGSPPVLLPAPKHHAPSPSLLMQGVTDAAVSLQTILGSRDGGAGINPREHAPAGRPAKLVLSPQQEQLKVILSMVVPFNAVSFKSAKDLAWSARRGLEELDACANRWDLRGDARSYFLQQMQICST